jgi:hypothetical protein
MKSQTYRLSYAVVKAAIVVSAIFLFCFFTVEKIAIKKLDDVWKQLGLTQRDAHVNINFSYTNGQLQYFGAKNAKNIALGERVAIVNQLVAYAKKYYAGDEFKNFYRDFRTKMKPAAPPALPVLSREKAKADEKQRLEKQLKSAEEGLNSTNPKVKNGAPTLIENIKKQISSLDDPDNPAIKRRMDQDARMLNDISTQYASEVQKFEEKYPADPQVLLRKRLQEMLDVTADVDYNAELKDGYGGKKIFADPAYEKKPAEWKLAFRAGKTATNAVRGAAQQWLKELK